MLLPQYFLKTSFFTKYWGFSAVRKICCRIRIIGVNSCYLCNKKKRILGSDCVSVKEWYKHRKDLLYERSHDKASTGQVTELFYPGRHSAIKGQLCRRFSLYLGCGYIDPYNHAKPTQCCCISL